MLEDHTLSLNNFNMPRVYKEDEANYMHIARLILLEPGKFQSHPDMGVGLKSRFRHNLTEETLYTLEKEIERQMRSYLPSITDAEVELTADDKILYINIKSRDKAYVLTYNNELDSLEMGVPYILNN